MFIALLSSPYLMPAIGGVIVLLLLLLILLQQYKYRALSSAFYQVADKEQQQVFMLQQLLEQSQGTKAYFEHQISALKLALLKEQHQQSEKLLHILHQHQQSFNQTQLHAQQQFTAHISATTKENREELAKSLAHTTTSLQQQMEALTASTDKRLKAISGEVEKRLSDGFEKTTKTFNDILKRLALIDDAQKKITELSSNVVSLQEVLSDKRSRGAFGEVQLNALIRNVLPEQHFSLQHTLSNGKIADCVLFLPKPTGNVVIDAKFPLESYRVLANEQNETATRVAAERQFKQDIKKHINDISDKYLIEHETSDGAVMFLPAEAVFAEIHAHHADLVEYANKKRVWLASPTTLMAILTTARSVLKDEATRQQVHIIQEHLALLAGDFSRFRTRFDNLAKHIDQAANDVKQIHTSANKISSRFTKIEQVELSDTKPQISLSEAELEA